MIPQERSFLKLPVFRFPKVVVLFASGASRTAPGLGPSTASLPQKSNLFLTRKAPLRCLSNRSSHSPCAGSFPWPSAETASMFPSPGAAAQVKRMSSPTPGIPLPVPLGTWSQRFDPNKPPCFAAIPRGGDNRTRINGFYSPHNLWDRSIPWPTHGGGHAWPERGLRRAFFFTSLTVQAYPLGPIALCSFDQRSPVSLCVEISHHWQP